MEYLVANLSGKVQIKRLHGRRHLVAPLTLIVPGVLNGSDGPLLYPPDEVSKNPAIWNSIPIVLNHPKKDGTHISARDAEVLESFGLGILLNSRFENGTLQAEGWFDIESSKRVSRKLMMAIEDGHAIEVSTGVFTKNEKAIEGANFNGTPYIAIARDYSPDHLAVLMDQVGACSTKDGCGINVNEAGSIRLIGGTGESKGHSHSVNVDDKGFGFTSFEDNHSHFIGEFVVESSEGHTHSLDKSTLINTAIRNSKENDMTEQEKTEIVNDLVTNCDCWEEGDREALMNRSDKSITKIHNYSKEHRTLVANASSNPVGAKEFTDKEGNKHTLNEKGEWETEFKKEDGTKTPTDNEKGKGKKTDVIEKQPIKLEDLPDELQEDIAFARNAKQERKDELIGVLTANIKDTTQQKIQAERLASRTLTDLEQDVKLLPEKKVTDNETTTRPSYYGQATPAVNREEAIQKPEPLGQPVWNFDPSKEKQSA